MNQPLCMGSYLPTPSPLEGRQLLPHSKATGLLGAPNRSPSLVAKRTGFETSVFPQGLSHRPEAREEGSKQPSCEIWGWGDLAGEARQQLTGEEPAGEKQGEEMGTGYWLTVLQLICSQPSAALPIPQAGSMNR